jgi:hypothetical protein
MDTTIRITTQYYENYGDSTSPHWKPKGGFEFMIKADADFVMYVPNLKAVLADMVANESNSHEKFEYIDHEVLFTEPFQLSTEDFENRVRAQYEQTQYA